MIEDRTPMAFFDFDGTLTTSDTLMPFLKYVVGAPTYYMKLGMVSPILTAYFAKVIRNDVAKQLVLKAYLSGYPERWLFDRGEEFGRQVIPGMLRPEGIELLNWHQAQGHRCILVSASLDIYLNAWADEYGFARALTSSLRVNDCGVVNGMLLGKNCYGEEKVRVVANILKERSPSYIYAYGDSKGDLPLLQLSNQGYLWSTKEGNFMRVIDR